MTTIDNFYKKVDALASKLNECEKNTPEWEMAYSDLYLAVYPKVESFCNKEIRKLKANDMRVSDQDYYSRAMGDIFVKLVDEYNPEEQSGFMKLLYFRVDMSFKVLFNASITKKQKALNTGAELDDKYFGTYEPEIDSLRDITVFEAIEEYSKINPLAKVLLAYELPYKEAMERIKREMGIEKYSNTDRWRIHNVKQKFFKYLQEQGYTHLTEGR